MVQVGVESENGWRPARVGADLCVWVTVPGSKVSLQLQKGLPAKILAAFAADYNAFVEPLRDPDSASWTPTNSVATSNHLNATAMDLNWNSHPFRVRGTFTAAQVKTIRELLAFYEDTVFWAGDWTDPIDEMHWQMGYGSWNNPKTASFASRKIRSDGFSTFRRGVVEAKPKDDVSQLPPAQPPVGWTVADQAEIRDKVRQIWGALFNPVPSKSRYANPKDLWATKDLIRNDDGFIFDLITEHDAELGDQAAIDRIKQAAVNGDPLAKAALAKTQNRQGGFVEVPEASEVKAFGFEEPVNVVATVNDWSCWNCGKQYPSELPECPFCNVSQQAPAQPPLTDAVEDPPTSGRHMAPEPGSAITSFEGLPSVNKSVVEQLSLLQRFGNELPPEVSSAIDKLIPVLKGLM